MVNNPHSICIFLKTYFEMTEYFGINFEFQWLFKETATSLD